MLHNAHSIKATTEASAPKMPPVNHSGPLRVDTNQPLAGVPETGIP